MSFPILHQQCLCTNSSSRLRCRRAASRSVVVRAEAAQKLATFPRDYPELINLAQASVQAALADGCKLIEVEFPVEGLSSVQGDGEGANEMTKSLQFMRTFLRPWQERAGGVRVFFPDEAELGVAMQGKGKDPSAGGWEIDPVFDQTRFQLDFLTQPSLLMDFSIDLTKQAASQRVQDSDELLVMAYPHFTPSEMVAVREVHDNAAQARGLPIVVFNGELDRIRSGYYIPLFYPKMGKMAKEWLPSFEQALYIHNFKGSGGGALFRAYPGPWQVFRRDSRDVGNLRLIHTQHEMPSLQEVALNILPRG